MADTTIAFFGIRLEVCDDDLEALELRSHRAVVNAKKAGLEHYWGNFGAPGERYLLFVGKPLGKLGVEDSTEIRVSPEQFVQIATDVAGRLVKAGFSDTPSLFLQFQADS
ncbi:MAG TPA: hypothetical protein VMS17_05180 [Gemmataceae bacterium]|nr:hypothetical protein [Gemmataceae bacterium]